MTSIGYLESIVHESRTKFVLRFPKIVSKYVDQLFVKMVFLRVVINVGRLIRPRVTIPLRVGFWSHLNLLAQKKDFVTMMNMFHTSTPHSPYLCWRRVGPVGPRTRLPPGWRRVRGTLRPSLRHRGCVVENLTGAPSLHVVEVTLEGWSRSGDMWGPKALCPSLQGVLKGFSP